MSEIFSCEEDAPDSTLVYSGADLVNTTSIKCTETLEVFYFDSEESKDEIYDILAGTEGTVRFAVGQNWFVVDYAQVTTTDKSTTSIDLAGLAEELGAHYTEVN